MFPKSNIMAIDLSKLKFTTVKKHTRSAAAKDPHCDVPSEVIKNLTNCIDFLDQPGVNINAWSPNNCPKLWKPIHSAGKSSRVQKKDGIEIPATPDSEAISFQWRLTLRNTEVYLTEEDCEKGMVFPGGTITQMVDQMKQVLSLLKSEGDNFKGVYANVAEFEKENGKVKIVNGRRVQKDNGEKKPTLITTSNYN